MDMFSEVEVNFERSSLFEREYKIVCDGEEDNNSFNMEVYGDDDFIVVRNRCELSVKIRKNKSNRPKIYTIMCRHSDESYTYVQINFNVPAEVYSVDFNVNGIPLEPQSHDITLLSIPVQKEEKVIDVTVNGGSGKWRFLSIYGYRKISEEEVEEIPFDNGIVCFNRDGKLVILNYGRTLMENGQYYLLRICHNDDISVTSMLKIKYDDVELFEEPIEVQSETAEQQPQRTRSTRKKKKMDEEVIEVTETEIIEEDYTMEYSIRWNNKEDADQYTVNGFDIFAFTVYEKRSDSDIEVVSNLSAEVSSSAKWCVARLDEVDRNNRSLYINIDGRAIGSRYSVVKLYIVDHPEIYKTFVVKNG